MDPVQLLGTTLGLGFAAGIRLYATVLALGLAIRFHWVTLPAAFQGLDVLSHPAVLGTAGLAYLIEFFSDKIPWVDTAWDAVHTIVRPLGAAALAFAAFATMDPVLRMVLVLLCGGVALTSHATKTATRLAVNHSPEPVSNIVLSLAGDVAAPALVWLAVNHPLMAALIVLVLLAAILWLMRAIVRVLRRGWETFRARKLAVERGPRV